MEKMKNVPNYPKWQENWTKMFLAIFAFLSPQWGSMIYGLKWKKERKNIVGSTKFEISQEDKLIGIGHHRKMTLKDDKLTSRQDEGFTERRHHRNLTLQEDDITKRQPYKKMASARLAS